jgi:hypothetical protein
MNAKKLLLATAIAVASTSATYAQDNGANKPDPAVLYCLQLSSGEWAWTKLQTNADGSVSSYPQYLYPNQDVDPDDPYGGDDDDNDGMPVLDTCDPPDDSGQTPVAGGSDVNPGGTGDPTTDPGNPSTAGGGGNQTGSPTPPTNPGPGKPKVAAPKPLKGPGHTVILINPKGKIVVHGAPGTVIRIGHDTYVITPEGPQPVVVVDPNNPGTRAIFTPDGKAVGVDPQGHVGVDPNGNTIVPPPGAEGLWLPKKTAEKTGANTPDGSGQPLKTKQPRIDETLRKSDATPSHAGEKTLDDNGKGNHAMRTLQEHATTAKLSEASTKANQDQFAHKSIRASDGNTERAGRNIASDRVESSSHVAHATETGRMSEMHKGAMHTEGHGGLAGMHNAGHGGMGGTHLGGMHTGGFGGLGGIGGMLMGALGRI